MKQEERRRAERQAQDEEIEAHKRHQRELAEKLEEQRAIEAVRLAEEAARDQCAARWYAHCPLSSSIPIEYLLISNACDITSSVAHLLSLVSSSLQRQRRVALAVRGGAGRRRRHLQTVAFSSLRRSRSRRHELAIC